MSVFERSHVGAGTSRHTFAWINSNGKTPESYHHLNALAIAEHIRLQQERTTEGQWLKKTGRMNGQLMHQSKKRLQDRVSRLMELNYPVQNLSPDALKRNVPEIRLDPSCRRYLVLPRGMLTGTFCFYGMAGVELHVYNAELKTQSEVTDLNRKKITGQRLDLPR
ncbi:Uncharacterised protein [Raoultella terrigena]|uniref:Uncharacterized protein n=1 Tax=Raoultella terrigena TaxID=577 RepID=A0A3P8KIQ3_RAOTE|nr:Uncharacterised protein [Raoultella terrigena]